MSLSSRGEDCRGLGLRAKIKSAEATQCHRVWVIRYAFNVLFQKIAEDLISACRKHAAAAARPSPFKVGDNQRPERSMSGVRKTSPESSVPGDNLNRGSRRNQLRRGHGSPPVLSEVPHELSTAAHSKECKRSPQQFIPAGFPLHDNLPTGTEDSARPLTTPDMVRSGRVLLTSAFNYKTAPGK